MALKNYDKSNFKNKDLELIEKINKFLSDYNLTAYISTDSKLERKYEYINVEIPNSNSFYNMTKAAFDLFNNPKTNSEFLEYDMFAELENQKFVDITNGLLIEYSKKNTSLLLSFEPITDEVLSYIYTEPEEFESEGEKLENEEDLEEIILN